MPEKIGVLELVKAMFYSGRREIFISMLIEFLNTKSLEQLKKLVDNVTSSAKSEYDDNCYRQVSFHGNDDTDYSERNRQIVAEQWNNEFYTKQKLLDYFIPLYDSVHKNHALLSLYEVAKANQVSA